MSLKSMDVTHSPVCREVQIIFGVSILNFSSLRNLLRLLRSSIGLHLSGFGTKRFLVCDQLYCIFLCQLIQCLQQVEVPVGIYIATDNCA